MPLMGDSRWQVIPANYNNSLNRQIKMRFQMKPKLVMKILLHKQTKSIKRDKRTRT